MRLFMFLLLIPFIAQAQLHITGVLQQEYNANFQILISDISQDGRLYEYDGSKWEEIMPIGDNGAPWYLVAAYKKKRVAGIFNGRLYYFDGSNWSEQQPAGDANKRWVAASMYEDKIIVGADNGRLYYFDGSNWSEQQPAGDANKGWRSASIHKGEIVACHGYGRLYRFNGTSWIDLQPTGNKDEIWVACAIYDGNILAATNTSLFYFNGNTWIESDPDTMGGNYSAVDIYKNKLVACTFSEFWGAVYYNNGSSWTTLYPNGSYGGEFWGIALRENKIIVTGNGVNYYNGSKWVKLFNINSLNVFVSKH